MSTAFAKLPRASWNGIEFPVRRTSVKGSLRYHVHEYPHAFGGAFENLQRRLYEIRMTCPFMQKFARYPDLWPSRWSQMRKQFETGEAGTLVIPTIGSIQARCISWPEESDAKIQSGVMVELEFIEDQSQLFLVDSIVGAAQNSMETAAGKFEEETAKMSPRPDLIDQILGIANGIFAFKDQVVLLDQLVEAKIRSLDAMIQEANDTIDFFQDPANYKAFNAMRDLWFTNKQLFDDLQGQRSPMQTYTVPMTMSVADVSTALYGNNSQAITLLQMNPIDDAFAIPAGTKVRYYPEAA